MKREELIENLKADKRNEHRSWRVHCGWCTSLIACEKPAGRHLLFVFLLHCLRDEQTASVITVARTCMFALTTCKEQWQLTDKQECCAFDSARGSHTCTPATAFMARLSKRVTLPKRSSLQDKKRNNYKNNSNLNTAWFMLVNHINYYRLSLTTSQLMLIPAEFILLAGCTKFLHKRWREGSRSASDPHVQTTEDMNGLGSTSKL